MRRFFQTWSSALLALVCLVMAARPLPARTASRVSSSPTAPPGGHPISVGVPQPVRPVDPGTIGGLDSMSRLERLNTSTTQNFDIVPPTHPRIPGRPLPGYQVVRLGRGRYNRLCLAVTVAGTKGLMMVDTGTNNTVLSDAIYRPLLRDAAAKLPTGLPRVVTLNDTRVPLAEAPEFLVGRSDLGAVPVCLVPGGFLSDAGAVGGQARNYDGLVGQNILRHYSAIIDCARLALYLDIDPARKLDQGRAFVQHGWTAVPMSDTGSHFTVPCVLNGHPFRLVVDTGAPFTNLDRDLLASAQVASHDLPFRTGLIGTESKAAGLVDLDRLQIGAYTATGVHMTATAQSLAAFDRRPAGDSGEPIIGLLGGDVLGRNSAVIDLGNRMLYLKHSSNPG